MYVAVGTAGHCLDKATVGDGPSLISCVVRSPVVEVNRKRKFVCVTVTSHACSRNTHLLECTGGYLVTFLHRMT